jgi:hypothetical protein
LRPAPGRRTLTGRVRLEGRLTDETNAPTGTRRIEDADDVPVVLIRPDGRNDTTRTRAGEYAFTDLPPGTYRVVSPIGAAHEVALPEVRIDDRDLALADTLALSPPESWRRIPTRRRRRESDWNSRRTRSRR